MEDDDGDLVNERSTTQLLSTIPTLSEAASYLSETTSLVTRCFTGNSDAELDDRHELSKSLEQSNETFSESHWSSLGNWAALFRNYSSADAFSPMHGDEQNIVESLPQEVPEPMASTSSIQNGSSIFQGLISRARKTVIGSAEDIGWLQHAVDMPPVENGTDRFGYLLERIRKGEHKLPNSVVYLLVPGLFSNHGPLYFVNTKRFFSKMGLVCHIAKIHSEASVERNAREIKDYIEEIYWGSNKRIVLLGHSKGGVDAAAALSLYWSCLKDKVAGLVIAQSPYGGSPVASDILREGQLGDYVGLRKLMEILICKVLKGDIQALEDLTYDKRREFLSKHPLPEELPVVSFHTETSMAPSAIATLSHVAQAELPLPIAPPLAVAADVRPSKLPVVVPLSAVMAGCARLLQIRYGEESDGLVARRDAEVPGSVAVRPKEKLDHAWMVYSPLNEDPAASDAASHVWAALLALLIEVAQKRRHDLSMKDE